MKAKKKLACLFPGIGYTCDKPLMYYSRNLLQKMGWEVVCVPYSGFPAGVKGNAEKKEQCVRMAAEQAEAMLKKVRWSRYDDILFVGKSVGTVVGPAYAKAHGIDCRQVLFTPVEDTFSYVGTKAIAFHGTADSWADTETIRNHCCRLGIPLYESPDANHSLETGHVGRDIRELGKVMRLVRYFAAGEERERQ